MKNQLSVLILSFILYNIVGASARNNILFDCRTPIDTLGLCIPLRNCTSLFNQILKGTELTPDDRLNLSRSQCGYDDSQPLVCCPDLTTTAADISQDESNIEFDGSCGIDSRDDYLIRGNTVKLGDYPWMVLLEYSKSNDTKGFNCVGVLIGKRYVLTAAHCLSGKNIPSSWNLTGVRLGEYNLLTDPDCEVTTIYTDCAPSVIDIPISEKIIHEHYDPLSKNHVNDIAVLRLESEVEFADFTKSICLPFQNNSFNYEDNQLDDVGWNRDTNEYSEQIMDRIKMISNSQCNEFYNRIGFSIEDAQICGLPQYETYKSCQVLPGRPLMRQNRRNMPLWYLVGIESFGSPVCGQEGWPMVYTRISSYADWIKSKIMHK